MTVEEIRMLAKLERDMDSGKQEFVVFNDSRLAVSKSTMEKFMLQSGQNVSLEIFTAIIESHAEECRKQIEKQGEAS